MKLAVKRHRWPFPLETADDGDKDACKRCGCLRRVHVELGSGNRFRKIVTYNGLEGRPVPPCPCTPIVAEAGP